MDALHFKGNVCKVTLGQNSKMQRCRNVKRASSADLIDDQDTTVCKHRTCPTCIEFTMSRKGVTVLSLS